MLVEDIQDIIERKLMSIGKYELAKNIVAIATFKKIWYYFNKRCKMTYLFDNINSKNKEKLLLMLEANTLHFKKDSTILSVIYSFVFFLNFFGCYLKKIFNKLVIERFIC